MFGHIAVNAVAFGEAMTNHDHPRRLNDRGAWAVTTTWGNPYTGMSDEGEACALIRFASTKTTATDMFKSPDFTKRFKAQVFVVGSFLTGF